MDRRNKKMSLIFEYSADGRKNSVQVGKYSIASDLIPAVVKRKKQAKLPAVSELQVVRHYTNLSQKNFSIDTNFYPLGSCTMKYNPRGAHIAASQEGFLKRHPASDSSLGQGVLGSLYELQQGLAKATGMEYISLTPAAGAQGEFAGIAMISAYHKAQNDFARTEILVPDAAHGTNPASAVMCGYKVVEIPTDKNGDLNLEALKKAACNKTAGIMLTNPSTLGVFERNITQIAKIVHEVGGLLYYDGANLNAILGRATPADMGFDVVHINLHKTFATPHGGGGPGAGPVGVNKKLEPFLPVPRLEKHGELYTLCNKKQYPLTIGPLSTWAGNIGILLRANFYLQLLREQGLARVSQFATLNANYLMKKLSSAGFNVAYPQRYATHEFIISLEQEAKEFGVTAMDFAKRLLDYGLHAPTTYFPLLIPECLLIEPTETESIEELDNFVEVMIKILDEAKTNPDTLRTAPHTMPVCRLDDVKAAREPNLCYNA